MSNKDKILIHENQQDIWDVLGEHKHLEPEVIGTPKSNSIIAKHSKNSFVIAHKHRDNNLAYSLEFCLLLTSGSAISCVSSINEYCILHIYKSNGQYCSINHELVGLNSRTDLIGSDSEIILANELINENKIDELFVLLRKISKKI